MHSLKWLQEWYSKNCDGYWEHSYGVKIDTLDNPGWSVVIDIRETKLADRPFDLVSRDGSETDWILCRVVEGKFLGDGGPLNLEEILEKFRAWVES